MARMKYPGFLCWQLCTLCYYVICVAADMTTPPENSAPFRLQIDHPFLDVESGYIPGAVYQDGDHITGNGEDDRLAGGDTVSVTGVNLMPVSLVQASGDEGLVQQYYLVVASANVSDVETADVESTPECGDDVTGPCLLINESHASESATNATAHWLAPETGRCFMFRVWVYSLAQSLLELHEEFCRNSADYMWYLMAPSGHVTSLNYPDRYPVSVTSISVIQAPEEYRIHLQFEAFDLEAEDDTDGSCYDYVKITTSSYSHESQQPLCGSYNPEHVRNLSFVSAGSYMAVTFVSDDRRTRTGFTAVYYILPETGCNVNLTAGNGTLSSMNYPGAYFPNAHCVYTIFANEDDVHIKLVFIHLDLEPRFEDACHDYILVDTLDNEGMTVILCGNMSVGADQLSFVSEYNWLRLTFHTDHVVQSGGFLAEYSTVRQCVNRTHRGNHGNISSVNFPGVYLSDQACWVTLHADDSSWVIQLQILMLDTEATYPTYMQDANCDKDYVEIEDGRGVHRRCGNWQGVEYRLYFVSHTSYMVIKFVSDGSGVAKGYHGVWQAVPSDLSLLPCPDGWQGFQENCFQFHDVPQSWAGAQALCRQSAGHLATVRDNQTEVAIHAMISSVLDAGSAAWIGASDMDYEGQYYWTNGARIRYSNWFPGWPQYEEYSGQPSDDGLSGQDCVELRRSFLLPSKGLMDTGSFYWNDRECHAQNAFICQRTKDGVLHVLPPSSPMCNAIIYASLEEPNGTVVSPGFPWGYENLVDCNITVQAPEGFVIQLLFQDFILEEHESCEYDRVILSSGDSISGDESVRCGNWTDRLKLLRFVTRDTSLRLRFWSDHSGTEVGFRAIYSLLLASSWCGGPEWSLWSQACYMVSLQNTTQDQAETTCQQAGGHLTSLTTPEEYDWIRALVVETCYSVSPFGAVLWLGGIRMTANSSWFWTDGEAFNTDGSSFELYPADTGLFPSCLSLSVTGGDSYGYQVTAEAASCATSAGLICKKDLNAASSVVLALPEEGDTGTVLWPAPPLLYYSNLQEVHWHIETGTDTRVYFLFESMDLEWQTDCLYDYISLGDWDARGGHVQRYCGSQSPWYSYATLSNSASVIFHSDYSVTGAGFVISWYAVAMDTCHSANMNISSGTLQSLNFPVGYLNDLDCYTVIQVDSASRVLIHVLSFKLNNYEGACADFLVIMLDPRVPTYNRTLCSDVLVTRDSPLQLVSLSNTVRLYIRTSATYNQIGYHLSYTTVSSANLVVNRTLSLAANSTGSLCSLNFPLTHPPDIHVATILQAPVGWMLDITVIYMQLHNSSTCAVSNDSLILLDTYASTPSVLGHFCGSQQEPVIMTSYFHSVTVLFDSSGDIPPDPGAGYLLTYDVILDPLFINKTAEDLNFDLMTCTNTTCHNGGICQATVGGFVCQCTGPYTGLLCAWTFCDAEPCEHGASCSNIERDYVCNCSSQYNGHNCEVNQTACALTNCNAHGRCVFGTAWRQTCDCDAGWTGAACNSQMSSTATGTSSLLDEPFWVGLIVVLVVLVATAAVWYFRRRCSHLTPPPCCPCKEDTRGKLDSLGGVPDHHPGSTLEFNYSNPSYTRESSPHHSPGGSPLPQAAGIPTIKVFVEDEGMCNGLSEVTGLGIEGGSNSDSNYYSGDGESSIREIQLKDDENEDGSSPGDTLVYETALTVPSMDGRGMRRSKSSAGRLSRQYSQESSEDIELSFRHSSLDAGYDLTEGSDSEPQPKQDIYHNAVSLQDGTSLSVVDVTGLAEDALSLGSPAVEHRRMNSAQRRKDFVASVRQTRSPVTLEAESMHSSGSHCRSCGSCASFLSVDTGFQRDQLREYRIRRPTSQNGGFSRSADLQDISKSHCTSLCSHHSDDTGMNRRELQRSCSRHSDTSACSRHHHHRNRHSRHRHRHHRHHRSRHRHHHKEQRSGMHHFSVSLDIPDDHIKVQEYLMSSRSEYGDTDPYSSPVSITSSQRSHHSSVSRSRRHHHDRRRSYCYDDRHGSREIRNMWPELHGHHRRITHTNSDSSVKPHGSCHDSHGTPGRRSSVHSPRSPVFLHRQLSRSLDLQQVYPELEFAHRIPIQDDSETEEPRPKRRIYTSVEQEEHPPNQPDLSSSVRDRNSSGFIGSPRTPDQVYRSGSSDELNGQMCGHIELSKRTPSGHWDKVTLEDEDFSPVSPHSTGPQFPTGSELADMMSHEPGHHLVLQRTHSHQPLVTVKPPMWDSAYQSTEQSMEQGGSKSASNTVSPTFSVPRTEFYSQPYPATYSPEDKRVTNQLELAARKLSAIMEAGERAVAEERSTQEYLGLPCSQGMFSMGEVLVSKNPKQRRQWPSRMLSMIADDESEAGESPGNASFDCHDVKRGLSPSRRSNTSGRSSVDLQDSKRSLSPSKGNTCNVTMEPSTEETDAASHAITMVTTRDNPDPNTLAFTNTAQPKDKSKFYQRFTSKLPSGDLLHKISYPREQADDIDCPIVPTSSKPKNIFEFPQVKAFFSTPGVNDSNRMTASSKFDFSGTRPLKQLIDSRSVNVSPSHQFNQVVFTPAPSPADRDRTGETFSFHLEEGCKPETDQNSNVRFHFNNDPDMTSFRDDVIDTRQTFVLHDLKRNNSTGHVENHRSFTEEMDTGCANARSMETVFIPHIGTLLVETSSEV